MSHSSLLAVSDCNISIGCFWHRDSTQPLASYNPQGDCSKLHFDTNNYGFLLCCAMMRSLRNSFYRHYSLFILRKPRSPLILNRTQGFLIMSGLYFLCRFTCHGIKARKHFCHEQLRYFAQWDQHWDFTQTLAS